MGSDDWEQQMLFGKQASPIPAIARIQHGHITAQEIRPFFGQSLWDSYFKFAIVRNPYDRFVSICHFLNRDNPSFPHNELQWMKLSLSRPRFRERVLVRPQVKLLIDSQNKLAVDYVGRYEALQTSLDEVMSRLGLPSSTLEQKNASEHAVYSDFYDEELRELVGEFYAEDLRVFDYDFE